MAVSSSLPVPSTTATFTPVRMPGSSPIVTRWPAGRRQQQVVQVAAEHADRLGLRLFAQPLLDVDLEAAEHLDLPRPADGFGQPRVGGAAALLDAGARRDAPFRNRRAHGVRPRPAARRRGGGILPCGRGAARGCDATARSAPASARIEVVRELRPSSSLPGTTVDFHSPRSHNSWRRPPTSSASSAKVSIRIQRAPSSAAPASATPLSASTNAAASRSGTRVGSCSRRSASGSRPASRAICAFVRRFGLNGR